MGDLGVVGRMVSTDFAVGVTLLLISSAFSVFWGKVSQVAMMGKKSLVEVVDGVRESTQQELLD